jgi:hypothetical protein
LEINCELNSRIMLAQVSFSGELINNERFILDMWVLMTLVI